MTLYYTNFKTEMCMNMIELIFKTVVDVRLSINIIFYISHSTYLNVHVLYIDYYDN